MGQKTNPNILHSNKTTNQNSKYIEKKTREFYLYTSRDLEIKKFVTKFFKDKGLTVQNCKLNYFNNHLDLFVTYQQSIASVNIINDINKSNKIKLVKNQNFLRKKYKSNFNNIVKSIKNLYNYENLNYKKDLHKSSSSSSYLKKKIKIKRIKLIKYYKKYLNLSVNKNIKNLSKNVFLESLFQSLSLFYNKKLSITLILKPLNNLKTDITKKQQTLLKKELIKLKKYQRNEFFKEGLNLVFSSVSQKNSAELIANYVATTLKKLKRHNFFLRFIKTLLTIFISKTFFKIIKGIKIKIKGRINGAPRAKHKILNIGKNMPMLSIDSSIDYSETTAYTLNGTMGVKVWICEKNL